MGASKCSADADLRPREGFRRGFSLLELMIALGLFASSLGVLLAAQTAAARHEAHAQKVFEASTLARDLLAETELLGFPEPVEEEGDFGTDHPDYAWKRSVREATLGGEMLDSA